MSDKSPTLWTVTIKSPTLTLKTKVDPNLSVHVACNRFRKKFPEETSQFALFVETSKTFLRLDDESIIGSIENLKDGCEILFFEKDFKGRDNKTVSVGVGRRVQSSTQHDEDVLKPLPKNQDASKKTDNKKKEQAQIFEKFFGETVVQCKNILMETKNLLQMLENQENDEIIFENARKTAQITIEFVSFVSSQSEFSSHPQYVFVIEKSKELRTKILSFLQASRTCASNRLDFMSKQNAINKSQEVVAIIKDFIKILNSFDEDEEEAEDTAKQVLKHSKQLMDYLNILAESVNKKDQTLFVATTRSLVAVMNELLALDQKLETGLYWELKQSTYNFVTSSHLSLSNPLDTASRDYFHQMKLALQEVLNRFLRVCCSKSKEMNKILASKVNDFSLKSRKFANENEEKFYRLKKNTTNRILHILRSKFDQFDKQWQSQAAYEADEVIENIIDEIDQLGQVKLTNNVNSDEEELNELQKIHNLQNSSDWQSMARKMRQLRTSTNLQKLVPNKIGADLTTEIPSIISLLSDSCLEILLTIQEAGSDTSTFNDNKRRVLSTSVQSFLKVFCKVLYVCKSKLKITTPQTPRDMTSKSVGSKTWKLNVEFQEKDLFYKKGIVIDVNAFIEDVVKDIVSKFPIDASKDYALYLKDSGQPLQPTKRLYEFHQLASEKSVVELKVLDPEGSELRRIIGVTFDSIISQVEETSSIGKIQPDIISVLSESSNSGSDNYISLKLQIEQLLRNSISNESNGLRSIVVQLIASLTILVQSKDKEYTLLLQIASILRQAILTLNKLLDSFETFYYVGNVNQKLGPNPESSSPSDLTSLFGSYATEDYIWNDDVVSPVYENQNKLKGGTLNQIVKTLTSEETVDNEFLSAFLITYRSFTTPFTFLQKLLQRFNVPKGKIDKKKQMQIRLRVGIVLKHWIEHQFEDLDKKILDTIFSFIDFLQADPETQELATLLRKELDKKIEARSKQKPILLESSELKLKTNGLSISEIFLQLNESEIARQLTSIDFNLFSRIKPSEFLNQAWNVEKLKHQAPNILAMISRSNKISFWISSMVLWFPHKKDRARIVSKLLTIGESLLDLRNYHTLMGIVAGLSMTIVSRLSETWAEVDPKGLEFFKKVQTLLSPTSSFKSYRQELAHSSSKGAVLPYLGTFLSDLTFTETGNPNNLAPDNLINWSKRLLIAKIIGQISLYQQNGFFFPTVEPIYTFLFELPSLEERELYDLSLLREPKKKN